MPFSSSQSPQGDETIYRNYTDKVSKDEIDAHVREEFYQALDRFQRRGADLDIGNVGEGHFTLRLPQELYAPQQEVLKQARDTLIRVVETAITCGFLGHVQAHDEGHAIRWDTPDLTAQRATQERFDAAVARAREARQSSGRVGGI